MAADGHLLRDLRLDLTQQQFRPVYRVGVKTGAGPGGRGRSEDLRTIDGRDNLKQAIILRLLTPRGEIAALGHPEYGSRLHELIGRVNNDTTRNLVKLHILESLQREPRIVSDETVARSVPSPGRRDAVDVTLSVTPVGASERVTIGPFTLEL